jgi:hypothetical protein
MAITNYGTLKTAVAAWINRNDLTAVIPDFISFGEGDIYNGIQTATGNLALRCRDNLVAAELTPVSGVITIPDDYLELEQVTMDSVGKRPITGQYFNRLQNYLGNTAAFAQINDDWLQYPLSDTVDTFDVLYFSNFKGTLVDDSDTNPVLTAYPDIYLYAALARAEVYIKNDSRKMTWDRDLESNIRAANSVYRRSKLSGATAAQRTQYREIQTTRTIDQS